MGVLFARTKHNISKSTGYDLVKLWNVKDGAQSIKRLKWCHVQRVWYCKGFLGSISVWLFVEIESCPIQIWTWGNFKERIQRDLLCVYSTRQSLKLTCPEVKSWSTQGNVVQLTCDDSMEECLHILLALGNFCGNRKFRKLIKKFLFSITQQFKYKIFHYYLLLLQNDMIVKKVV